jgi:hypothetical protein
MSSKYSRQIECLARLEAMCEGTQASIIEFLKEESLMTKGDSKAIISGPEISKALHTYLASLAGQNKVQLLSYEWSILPVELIKVTIITDRAQREFTYGY